VQAANEFADSKGYCGDYDEFMEDHRLAGPSNSSIAMNRSRLLILASTSATNSRRPRGRSTGQAIADVLASRCVCQCRCRDVIDTEEA